ncbi:MAG: DUF1924 domain-containing protein [Motiliproteus sp.]
MKPLTTTKLTAVMSVAATVSQPGIAATDSVTQLLNQYRTEAGVAEFSAERGQELWTTAVLVEGDGRRCGSCHTDDLQTQGKHQKTNKPIAALAPSVNSKRLQKTKTIQKWLKRNCKWTFGRECSAQEKGDLLSWISQQ